MVFSPSMYIWDSSQSVQDIRTSTTKLVHGQLATKNLKMKSLWVYRDTFFIIFDFDNSIITHFLHSENHIIGFLLTQHIFLRNYTVACFPWLDICPSNLCFFLKQQDKDLLLQISLTRRLNMSDHQRKRPKLACFLFFLYYFLPNAHCLLCPQLTSWKILQRPWIKS